jgi:hypothetical protein
MLASDLREIMGRDPSDAALWAQALDLVGVSTFWQFVEQVRRAITSKPAEQKSRLATAADRAAARSEQRNRQH